MDFQVLSSEIESDYLNETKAARYLNLSVCALRSRNAKGDITSLKVGHTRFYRKVDLDDFLDQFEPEIRTRQARAKNVKITRTQLVEMLASVEF